MFGNVPDKEEIKQLLSVLVAANYVNRTGEDERYLTVRAAIPFLDIPNERDALIASNLYLLTEHSALYKSILA